MSTFLEEIIEHILEKYPGQTGDLCIVTPNQRAGLFLRKYLSERVDKPMWAPDMFSIEDFINHITGYAICDRLQLMLEFFEVYQEIEKEHAGDADSFFSWAPAVLRDFDDIDHALAERNKLYDHLVSARYIDTWNPDGSELTTFQKSYLAFLEKLKTYHDRLAARLTARGMAWQGLSSRRAAELLTSEEADLPWSKVIFTGFNALTPAEETVIHTLIKKGQASYHIDADAFYAEDPEHEAGRFIRKYRRKFNLPKPEKSESHYSKSAKNIRIYGVAKQANQARLAGNLLKDQPGLTPNESTAVVLADENLLIPVLNALPEEAGSINVTMGYPLSKTNMYAFFDSLFKLHLHALTSASDSQTPVFHHKDLHRFFSHSISALNWDPENGREKCIHLLGRMKAANLSFCNWDDLCKLTEDQEGFRNAFAFLRHNWNADTSKIFHFCTELTISFDRLLREKAAKQGRDIVKTPYFADFESLIHFARMFRQMEEIASRYPFLTKLKTFYRLIRQSASEVRLSFTGEPLEGLQVMGMLETRSLDFNNILILSVNEGILPKPKPSHSLIPYDIKKIFGLRLYHEQDAIYAYHFYRLLQRAENISLIYNTQAKDLGSNEKSRYITQLQHELPAYNPSVVITEETVSLPPPVDKADATISIPKSADIMERLRHISGKGFSPSALSRYIQCPLRFYFEKVAGIEETEEVEETLEARTLGTVMHGILEDLYHPLTGNIIRPEDLETMGGKLEAATEKRFREEYSGGNMHSGKNLLLYHLTIRYLQNLLKAEQEEIRAASAENVHITLHSLEEKLRTSLPVSAASDESQVTIKGLADRIDRKGGVFRIIDYKTGNINPAELKISDWSEPVTDPAKEKSFQLLCYAWMAHRIYPDERQLEPGIISTRTPGKGLQTLQHPGGKGILTKEHLDSFEEALKGLILEILDPSKPFNQTEDEQNCRYCAFRVTCRRH